MEGLGINWQLLVAQLVNFGIIFGLLVWLLKKPLAKVLRERSETIEASLRDAQHLQEQRAALETEKQAALAEAKAAAEQIVQDSQKVAAGIQKQATKAAEEQSAKLIAGVKAELAKQKEQLTDELKDELVVLLRESVNRSVKELSADQQAKLVDQALAELQQLRHQTHG